MHKACAKNDDIAKRAGAKVQNALVATDRSDLKVSLRQALSFSIPPLTLSQLSSRWIFNFDFRCSLGRPWNE